MKIREAIELAKKEKKRICSKECGMFAQDAKSLIYWLFVEEDHNNSSTKTYLRIITADDWELDNETFPSY